MSNDKKKDVVKKKVDVDLVPIQRGKFSPQQWIAIEYLALPHHGGLSYEQIAEECGVDRKTLYKWRQNDEFLAEVKKKARRLASERVPDVIDALYEMATKNRSAKHAELFLKWEGSLKDETKIELQAIDNRQDSEAIKQDIDELKRLLEDVDGYETRQRKAERKIIDLNDDEYEVED